MKLLLLYPLSPVVMMVCENGIYIVITATIVGYLLSYEGGLFGTFHLNR